MSIDKVHHDYVFGIEDFEVSCDFCDQIDAYSVEDGWKGLMECMRNDGWESTKQKDKWLHRCKECRDEQG